MHNSVFPSHLQDHSSKVLKNKRDNFKAKAKKFFVKDEDLYRFVPGLVNGARVVTKGEVKLILEEFHGSAFGGHSGVNRTTEAVQKRYWWKGVTDDVKAYIRSCEACQKSDPLKPARQSELQQIKVSSPFELVGVDLIGPFTTTSQGHHYIFTATDYYTKWVEAFPIPSKQAKDVAKCFEKLFARHGAVNAILTDQGREFVNSLNDHLCKEWNIKHKVTAAYHPQTNGLDERTNQTLKATLRKLVNDHQTNWDEFIDAALFAIRTKPQTSTKFSPFFLLYGREAVYPSQLPKHFDVDKCDTASPTPDDISAYVEHQKNVAETTRSQVGSNVSKAQDRQKSDYKKKVQKGRQCHRFSVGDVVLRHNTRKAITKRKGNLEANYDGPYTVVDITGNQAVLQNKSGTTLKAKCNLDRLKLFNFPESANEPSNHSNANKSSDTNLGGECATAAEGKSPSTPAGDSGLNPLETEVEQYMAAISRDGSFERLLQFVTKDFEQKMEMFSSKILPKLRHLTVPVSEKTTLTLLLSALCCQACQLYQPVICIAQTVLATPGHLQKCKDVADIGPRERLSVGGETVDATDLLTLNDGQWLNDKVINAFLRVVKEQVSLTDSQIFVLPSYIAVLWGAGDIGHWLFRKVKFLKFKYVLLPVCVNGNHWILLVGNTADRTVSAVDSMNGTSGERFINLWSQYMQLRDASTEVDEIMGPWTPVPSTSNRQMDGHSCGVFVLMNAEALALNVPMQVMRQVHCQKYREYIKNRLIESGTTKKEDLCDLPNCTAKKEHKDGYSVACVVAGATPNALTFLPRQPLRRNMSVLFVWQCITDYYTMMTML